MGKPEKHQLSFLLISFAFPLFEAKINEEPFRGAADLMKPPSLTGPGKTDLRG